MNVGDVVMYHSGSAGHSVLAIVEAVAAHDGDLDLSFGDNSPHAVDVKCGLGPHTWEPLDGEVWWTIEHCPDCGRRNPSFATTCATCGADQ